MERTRTLVAEHASFELAALRLHLVVGMAAADDEIHDSELAELRTFVDSCGVSPGQHVLLHGLLDRLLADPPGLEHLLRSLVDTVQDPALAQVLVGDLVAIAHVDDRIDPREEGLLRLICGALGLEPVSLYDDADRAASDATGAELAALVRALIDLGPPG